MYELVLIIHVILCCALVGMVLIQQGKGSEVGAAFGGGASQTVFGGQGAGSFITRVTAILAASFFATSLSLSYIAVQSSKSQAVLDLPISTQEKPKDLAEVPALPESSEVPAQQQ